jgi:hypothetical protein
MHFSTPDCYGSTSDNHSVGVGFVGVTCSDMDLQDKEEPMFETAMETAGSQIDIANNVSPEAGFRFASRWVSFQCGPRSDSFTRKTDSTTSVRRPFEHGTSRSTASRL